MLRKTKKSISVCVILLMTAAPAWAQEQALKLWYSQPAGAIWEAALPVGNGRLGAMVYGNPAEELIRLNENTVWSGSPNRNENHHALAALPEVRKLIFEGKMKDAADLAAKTMQSERINGMCYQPVGDLQLHFPAHEQYQGYYRELNLEKAVATTAYTVNGIKYTRRVFASIPDQVMVVRLTAEEPRSITFSAALHSPQQSRVAVNGSDELVLSGVSGDKEGVPGKVKFQSLVKFKVNGGTVSTAGDSIQISRADDVTIYISIATNFINYADLSADEGKRAVAYLDKVGKKGYEEVLKDHIAAYQHYFNRVQLYLGNSDAERYPTDVRLKNFAAGYDPQLVVLYFQFGRYLLIASSQPGGQPANLQGIWNPLMNPPWGSKYTININTEMNYWPAEITNLTEMHEPLVQMVKDLSVTGRETAKVMYGAGGWVTHHNTDLWRITGPVDPIYYGMWPMGGAWLSRHLWEKYMFSGDKQYLQSVYPALKGAAAFYLDFLVEEPTHHWLVVAPSISPENNPKAYPGVSMTAGATMDNQLVFDLLSNTIHAAEVLHTDAALVEKMKAVRKKLPPMQVGQYGQLQEWLQDLDNPEDKHRHVSHLFGLYPANQVAPESAPALFNAARTSLIQRGDVSTGWSMGWKVNLWARLRDGNHAWKLIKDQLTPAGVSNGGGTYPNLFDAHPPFQIDGNFGCTAGISEMLLQSQAGCVHLLPALPDEWKSGRVAGLRARGGFEIKEMVWEDGKLAKVTILSTLGGNCRLRVPNALATKGLLQPATGTQTNPFYQVDAIAPPLVHGKVDTAATTALPTTIQYDLMTEAGKTYTFTRP
ncbi:glycosyl hydrolase family 95 catalytic domain-containing protein [Chitinophaga eiseniae]|uniref:Glycoside hydrolase family 95 protein n=1 Tax=Chitinophaga eiseniae TaxID=634771 RepID=A0A847SPX0_9BACT|nr:glycoside hydrolase family 95 protein [Chitinophaga eiseniae]NLR81465.1 glycoside hydrolase family 95 protein [Chitinophaga eiseniae]